jgi:hypothetical protein
MKTRFWLFLTILALLAGCARAILTAGRGTGQGFPPGSRTNIRKAGMTTT